VTTASEGLAFRRAREADLDRLADIHMSAYPDERGPEARRRNFVHNALGGLDDLWVVEAQGGPEGPSGHAFLLSLEAWFGGVRVPVGGVASVGVAPEARGHGLARALLEHLHAESKERGDAATLLYAFRQGFYAPEGYAPVTPSRRLALSPRSIPRAWAHDEPGCVVHAASGADRTGLERVYEQVAALQTGWIARSARFWERKLSHERRHWFVLDRRGSVAGYVAWTLAQDEPHAATTLVVQELVALDDDGRRRLLGLVGSQRDQVTEIQIDVDARDPLDRALVDLDRERWGTESLEHCLGALVGGPMVRVADVTRAFEARGYPRDGELDIVVDDSTGDAAGSSVPALHLEARGGRGRVGLARGGPSIRLGRAALGAVLYGGLLPSEGARLRWVFADEPSTLRRADALLELPPFFSIDSF
jgi:predicted acetyltransferase